MSKKIFPYITNDGSVGLYSPEFDDIYHSTYGAYSEAVEKFILPADMEYYITNFEKIKVLDICYGIGYNTKSFLNFYFEKFLKNKFTVNNNTDAIYSNNNSTQIDNKNESVKTPVKDFCKNIFINAIDMDEDLVCLSPFFLTNANKIPKNQALPTEKVKSLSSGKLEKHFSYDTVVDLILLEKIKYILAEKTERILSLLNNTDLKSFLNKKNIKVFKRLYLDVNSKHFGWRFLRFLHNIYYCHISSRYKNALKALQIANLDIEYNLEDARKVLLHDEQKYQLVFLDAFTPTKCPCLWTVDFLRLIYEHLDDNGRVLTYSNSAQIRNAFINAGFYVGKIKNERTGKFTGTIAVKNKSFIKHDLSEYDLRLVKTRAGIFYRDKSFSALNEAIIEQHKKEVAESTLISSSQFIKQWEKEHKNV